MVKPVVVKNDRKVIVSYALTYHAFSGSPIKVETLILFANPYLGIFIRKIIQLQEQIVQLFFQGVMPSLS